MCLDIFLDRIFLLEVVPHASYAQGQVGASKTTVHPIDKFLPRVLARAIQPGVIPSKSKAFKEVTCFSDPVFRQGVILMYLVHSRFYPHLEVIVFLSSIDG